MARSGKQGKKVISYIKDNILQNHFTPGSKLPAENTLAEMLGVSRVTVRGALEQLAKEGCIEQIFGRGAFVSNTPPESSEQSIIPFISQYSETNSSFFDIYNGIQDCFAPLNLHPLLSISGFDYNKERETIREFFEKGYRHMLILSGFSNQNFPFYHSLMQQGANLVFLDKHPSLLTCDCVTSDNFNGAYLATNYLISKGHKRIVLCAPQYLNSATSIEERVNGYRFAMSNHGLWDPELVFEWQDKSAESFADYLLSLNTGATAIFCLADFFAIPLVNYLSRKNIHLSVVGFDNLKETASANPPITTVNQSFYRMGYTAAELLHQRMQMPDRPFNSCSIPVELIERESVFPLKQIK